MVRLRAIQPWVSALAPLGAPRWRMVCAAMEDGHGLRVGPDPAPAPPVARLQEQLVLDLTNPNTKETALLELSKKRESFPELAPYLWHSFGTMAALLQEIVSIYPMLQPPSLTAHASNRVCNALALLQCVASHPETRSLFLQGACPPAWGGWAASTRPGVEAERATAAPLAARLPGAAPPASHPPPRRSPRPCFPLRSAHPSLPVPLPQHRLQDKAVRVPSPDQSGCGGRAR